MKPAVTTAYWVRVTNDCDPPTDSGTVFAIVNNCPPVSIDSQSADATILEGRELHLQMLDSDASFLSEKAALPGLS